MEQYLLASSEEVRLEAIRSVDSLVDVNPGLEELCGNAVDDNWDEMWVASSTYP
jgi:hypothetical protein